jgi:hypothetical protein
MVSKIGKVDERSNVSGGVYRLSDAADRARIDGDFSALSGDFVLNIADDFLALHFEIRSVHAGIKNEIALAIGVLGSLYAVASRRGGKIVPEFRSKSGKSALLQLAQRSGGLGRGIRSRHGGFAKGAQIVTGKILADGFGNRDIRAVEYGCTFDSQSLNRRANQ